MRHKSIAVALCAVLVALTLLLSGCPTPTEEMPIPPEGEPAASSTSVPSEEPSQENSEEPSESASATESPDSAAGGNKLTFLTSMDQARKKAQSAKLPMVVDFAAEWCGWCTKMEEESFPDPGVQALGSRFVWVRLDADADPGILGKFQVDALPTLLVLDPSGKEISRYVGYMPGPELANFLEQAAHGTGSG